MNSTGVCKGCGKEFKAFAYEFRHGRKFCSASCAHHFNIKYKHPRIGTSKYGDKGWQTCVGCNARFFKLGKLKKYCTRDCWIRNHITWNKGKTGVYSDEYRNRMSVSRRGRKSWNRGLTKSDDGRIAQPWLGKKRPPVPLEVRERISIGLRGRSLSAETRQRIRSAMFNNPNSVLNNPLKVFRDTKIELSVERELQKFNIPYQKQVPLCNIAVVDFYLPTYNVVIQCDGCYWHACPSHFPNNPNLRKSQRDTEQDLVLKENGYLVYRFWEHEIKESAENCLASLPLLAGTLK